MGLWDYQPEIRTIHSNSRKIFRRFLAMNTLSLIFAHSAYAPGWHFLKTCSSDHLLGTVPRSINTRDSYPLTLSDRTSTVIITSVLYSLSELLLSFLVGLSIYSTLSLYKYKYISYGISPSCKSQKPTQYAFIIDSGENHSIGARP